MTDRTSFDTATRIVAGDDGTNYDPVAVTLHWAVALLVLFQFISAIIWDDFPRSARLELQSIHVSFGVIFAALVIARLAWRLVPGHQLSSLDAGWVRIASKVAHYLLYLLLVSQAVSGFVLRWSQGHPVSFFGLDIPAPFGAVEKATRHQIHAIHEWIGWTIVIVAFAHALAALYHHYLLKDRVLGRMFPPVRKAENL